MTDRHPDTDRPTDGLREAAQCDVHDCEAEATCGIPTQDGYKRICGPHYREYAATPPTDGTP
jgi:hypothetical protein